MATSTKYQNTCRWASSYLPAGGEKKKILRFDTFLRKRGSDFFKN